MVWVVRGHSRSLEIAPFDKAHINEFTLAVHRNNVSILQIVEITFSVACGKCWLFDKPYQNLVKCIFTLNYRTVSYKSGTRNALVMHLCTWTIRRNRTVCSHSEFQAENQWNVCLYIWLKLSVCLSVSRSVFSLCWSIYWDQTLNTRVTVDRILWHRWRQSTSPRRVLTSSLCGARATMTSSQTGSAFGLCLTLIILSVTVKGRWITLHSEQ